MRSALAVFLFVIMGCIALPGFSQSSPAGIGSASTASDSLILWLRADSLVTLNGSSQVTDWGDLSGNGNDFTSGSTFTVNSTGLNNRPTIDMSETSNGFLSGPNTASLLGNTGNVPDNVGDVFFVFEQAAGNSGYAIQFPRANSTSSFMSFVSRGGANGSPVENNEANDIEVFFRTGASAWGIVSSDGSATQNDAFTDGAFHVARFGVDPAGDSVYLFTMDSFVESVTSANASYNGNSGDGPMRIGSSSASQDYNGEVAEVIIFGDVLNSAQYIILQNYFNARYALTTSNDLYTGTYMGTDYLEDLVGIGNEGSSEHMSSTSSGGGIFLEGASGTGSTLFDADEWIFAGHDGGLTSTTPANVPDAGFVRLQRIWKIEKTEGVSNPGADITVTFNLDDLGLTNVAGFTLYKRTDDVSDFTNLGITPSLNGSEVSFSVSDSDTDDATQFFTLGFEGAAPGGISTDLTLWLQPDNGVETTGSAVDNWRDQTTNTNDATDPSGLAELRTNITNFQSGVNFNADPTSLEGQLTTGSSNLTIFGIYSDSSGSNSGGALFELNGGGQSHPLYDNSYAGGAAFSSNIPKNQTALFAIDHPAGTAADLYLNGNTFESGYTTTATGATATFDYTLGDDDNGGNTYQGIINELVVYDETLSAAQREQVSSYLAVKYGLTLGHDYLDSDGTLIFDVDNSTANDGYESTIAALGRDVASGLNQKVSRSDSLIIALEEDYTTSNDGRSGGLDDKEFFFVSDNGGDFEVTTANGNTLTNKVWKVNEVGTVGTINLGISTNTYPLDSLLISTDPTFGTGVTRVAVSQSGSFNSVSYDFNDGDYFTFSVNQALSDENPNLLVWLKADSGVTASSNIVTLWADQGGLGNDADNDDSEFDNEAGLNTLTEGAVSISDNIFNFNPAVNFSGDARPITGSVTTTGGFTFFIVGFDETSGSNTNAWFDTYVQGSAGGANDRTYFFKDRYAGNNNFVTQDNITTIYSIVHPEGTIANIYEDGGDFQTPYTVTNGTNDNDAGTYLYVIGDDATGGNEWEGQIAEFIIFQDGLGDLQRKGIESYLAIKYGISYQDDYTTPSGSVIFNRSGSTNDGFENNIMAIAREDAIELDQKVARSQSGSLILAMEQNFESTNPSRTSTFSDQSYTFVSSNLGSVAADSTYRGFASTRIGRKWKINETNNPGAVYVALSDGVASELNVMLVSSDSSFSVVEEVELFQSGGYYYANYDFSDGQYFTFAYSVAPAGLVNGLRLWLRSDSGVTETSNNVSAWADQSGNGGDGLTPGTDPLLTTGAINFNPAINFSSGGTRVQGSLITTTDSLTVFIVATDSSGSSSGNVLFEFDDTMTPLTFDDGNYGGVAFASEILKDTTQLLTLIQPEGSGSTDIFQNGASFESGITPSAVSATTYTYALGENVDGGNGLQGLIAEFIVFDSALSVNSRQKLETYLAVKYAMPVPNDLVSANGDIILDASESVGYLSGLTALGRDDRSLLDQKVAKSVYDSLYLATEEDFITANESRTSAFSDEQYLAITNNGGDFTVNSDYKGQSNVRLDRVWKVHELNNPGSVFLAFPNTGVFATLQTMLISNDPNFESGVFEKTLTVSGGYNVIERDLGDGQYFTFTTSQPTTDIWYSYLSGDWSDTLNWTLDGAVSALYVNPNAEIPSEGDSVVIKSGRSITADFNGICIEKMELIGTLDLGNTSGHDFTYMEGSGVLRLAGAAGLDNYPDGIDTLFYSTTEGGRVEYYGSGLTLNQTRRYKDLTIELSDSNDDIVLTGDSIYVFGNLTINSGEYQINNNSATNNLVTTVFGDVLIEENGGIGVGSANARHEFDLYGDFTNLGQVDFTNRTSQILGSDATDGIVDVNFISDDQNQSVSLFNNTDFYRIEVDKGVDKTYEVAINAADAAFFNLYGSAFDAHPNNAQLDPDTPGLENDNAVGLFYGTLRAGNGIDLGELNNGGNYNVSEGAALIIDGGSTAKSAGTAIVLYGDIEVNSGTLDAPINSGITNRDNGQLTINGGTVTVNQYRTSVNGASAQGGLTMTGGIFNVTGVNTNTGYYIFSLTYEGNVFNMSGGTLNLSGSNTQGGIYINSAEENISVTGGEVNLDVTNANDLLITSTAPFFNLNVLRTDAAGSGAVIVNAGTSGTGGGQTSFTPDGLVVLNDFKIDSTGGNGTVFDANGFDVNVTGSLIVDPGTTVDLTGMEFTFDGAGGSSFDIRNGSRLDLDTLIINKNLDAVIVDISNGTDTAILVNNYLNLANGQFDLDTFQIKVAGNINIADTIGTTSSTGKLFMTGSSEQSITSVNGFVYDIEVDSANGVDLNGDFGVDSLILDAGVFDINTHRLTALSPIQTNGSFGTSLMIQSDGNASDGGLEYYFDGSVTDPTSVIYPIGTDANATVRYTPVSLDLSGVTMLDDGYVSITISDTELQTTNLSGGNILSYYWRVGNREFGALPTAEYTFTYADSDDDATSEASFVPGKVLDEVPFTRSSELIGNVNTTTNVITFDNDGGGGFTLENANYTAGVPARFTGSVETYYSYAPNGSWVNYQSAANWSTVSHTDPTNTGTYPQEGDVAIIGSTRSGGGTGRIQIRGNTSNDITIAALIFDSQAGGTALNVTDMSRLRIRGGRTFTAGTVSGLGEMVQDIGLPGQTATIIGDFGEFLEVDDSGWFFWFQSVQDVTISDRFDYPIFRTFGSNGTLTFSQDVTAHGVVIDSDTELRITTNYTVDSLVLIGSNQSGALEFRDVGSNLTFETGDLIFSDDANNSISVQNSGSDIHRLIVNGDIDLDEGTTFDLTSGSSQVEIEFTGEGQHSFENSAGITPDLYRIIMDKGVDTTNTFTFNTVFTLSGPTTSVPQAVELQNGKLIFNSAATVELADNSDFTIPGTSGLELTQGTFTSTDATILLDGLLRVNGASVTLGSTDIEYSTTGSALLNVSSGSLEVGGQIRRSTTSTTGVLKYRQTGGDVDIATDQASTTSRASFEVLNSGSEFTLTGGTFNIHRGVTGDANESLELDPEANDLTGSTITIFENLLSDYGANFFNIKSAIPLPNLTIEGSVDLPDARLYTLPLEVEDLTINTNQSLLANGFDLTITGDVVNNGLLQNSTGETILANTGSQSLSGSGTWSLFDLRKNGSGTTTASVDLVLGNDLYLTAGVLDIGSSTISLQRDAYVQSTFSNSGGNGLVFNGTANQELYGLSNNTIEIGTITIENLSGVDIPDGNGYNFDITQNLRLDGGVFNIGGSLVTIRRGAVITDVTPFGINNMVQTNSSFTDNGLKQEFPSVASDTVVFFPIGETKYTPVQLNLNSGTTQGAIRTRPANERHPTIVENAESPNPEIVDADNVLQYHWIVVAEELTNANGSATFFYEEADALVTSPYDTSHYIPARLLSNDINWDKYAPTFFLGGSETFEIPLSNATSAEITGDYTAGVGSSDGINNDIEGAIPNTITQYESVISGMGSYSVAANWNPLNGSPAPTNGVGPVGAQITISSGDTLELDISNIRIYATVVEAGGVLYVPTGVNGIRLGIVSGSGTIVLEDNELLPTGEYSDFLTCSGGALQYSGTSTYNVLSGIPQIRSVTFEGSGTRTLPNNALTVCDVFLVDGPTVELNTGQTYVIGDADTDNMEVRSGSVSLSASSTIDLTGDFLVSGGSFSGSTGTSISISDDVNFSAGTLNWNNTSVTMNGTTEQLFDGDFTGTAAFDNLEINNTGSGVTINTGDILINGILTLTDGLFNTTSSETLVISSTGSYSGGSSASYITGPMTKNSIAAASTYTFPVGKAARYAPAAIVNVGTGNDNWTTEYFTTTGAFTSTSFDPDDPGSGKNALLTVRNTDRWEITSAGSNSAQIRVSYGAHNFMPDNESIRVVWWDGDTDNRWENRGGIISGNSTSGTVTSEDVISFSTQQFGLGLAPEDPLPVELVYLRGSYMENRVRIWWKTATEINNDYFEVERSRDGENFEAIGKVTGGGNSSGPIDYEFFDLNPYRVDAYYRLVQYDYDGETEPSKIILVESPRNVLETSIDVYPNPITENRFTVSIEGLEEGELITLQVVDLFGKMHHFSKITYRLQPIEVRVDNHMKPGIYTAIIDMDDRVQVIKLLVR